MATDKTESNEFKQPTKTGHKPGLAPVQPQTEHAETREPYAQAKEPLRFLTIRELMQKYNRRHTTIYKLIGDGLLPPQVKNSDGGVVWVESEIEEVMKARVAGWSNDRIKALVAQLVAQREQPAWSGRLEHASPQTQKPKSRLRPLLQAACNLALTSLRTETPIADLLELPPFRPRPLVLQGIAEINASISGMMVSPC